MKITKNLFAMGGIIIQVWTSVHRSQLI